MATTNTRIKTIDSIIAPKSLLSNYPISIEVETLVNSTRASISDILHRRDNRLLVVVGPCSIHDVDAAMDYAHQLKNLRSQYSNELEIVMRVYFEKPRSTIGWKGLINDPGLDRSFDVNKGLTMARTLLLELNKIGVPAGCEFLDVVTGQYYADLVSWGAIGARTTESQIHRELASGLSCPVGFKNGTNGNIDIAGDAVIAARTEHVFLSPTEEGNTALFTTSGNQDAHVILRGGRLPNYDATSVSMAADILRARHIDTGLMIDLSHANSQNQHRKQIVVASDVASQIKHGNRDIVGCMIESHLVEGKQDASLGNKLVYGQSITDACVDLSQTQMILENLATAISYRNNNPKSATQKS